MLPVCIPSYKNREITKKLFSQLSTFDDVYLFVYDFDYKESGYDKLELPSNVKVIQINIDRDFKKYNVKRTDLSTKRCFIFDYMTSLGIDTYISIDDDCGDQHFIRENDKLEKVELKTFIDKMYEKILTLDKWCIVSPFVFLSRTEIRKKYKADFIYDYAWEGSVMFINRKVLSKNNVKHVPLTSSDIAFNISCLKKGLTPLIINNFYTVAFQTDQEHSTLSEKHKKEVMFTFKYFPEDSSIWSWYNTENIGSYGKYYLDVLNGETKLDKKMQKIYEYALNEDLDNFIKSAKEYVFSKKHKKINTSKEVNEEW